MNIHTAIVHSCEIMRKHEIYISVILNFYKKDSCVDEYNSGFFDYLIQLASIVKLIMKKEI